MARKKKAEITALAKAAGLKDLDNPAYSQYTPDYCKSIVDHFTIADAYKAVVTTKSYYKDGAVKLERSDLVPTPPPHIGQFARKIGVTKQTLYNWIKKYPEFKKAYEQCLEMRSEMVRDNALIGLYDSKFAQFAAINMAEIGWKQQVEHNVKIDDVNITLAWKERQKLLGKPDVGPKSK